MAECANPHAHQYLHSYHDLYSRSADRYASATYWYRYDYHNGHAYVYPFADVYSLPHPHHYSYRNVYRDPAAYLHRDADTCSADANLHPRSANPYLYSFTNLDGNSDEPAAAARAANADPKTVRRRIHA